MTYRAFTPQTSGFAYTKDEMLQIYRDGHFKDAEFTDKFQHVANATTPEFLIPLALLPIESEEAELRLNPVVTGNPQGPAAAAATASRTAAAAARAARARRQG